MDENMKRSWQETRFYRPDRAVMEEVMNGRRLTALESLGRRYRCFSIVSSMMVCCSLLFSLGEFPFIHGLPLTLAFCFYFLVCSTMDFWLYMGVRSIDIQEMTVAEVAGKAMFYRKRHLQFMAILIPMAAALLTFLIWTVTEDAYMIVGIASGGLIGLALGIRQFMRFMADYRTLVR